MRTAVIIRSPAENASLSAFFFSLAPYFSVSVTIFNLVSSSLAASVSVYHSHKTLLAAHPSTTTTVNNKTQI